MTSFPSTFTSPLSVAVVVGALLERDADLHLVAGLHEVAVADLARAGKAPLLPRLLFEQVRGERAHAAEDEHPGEHMEAGEVAVEDRERVRDVPKAVSLLARLDADDAVEPRPA